MMKHKPNPLPNCYTEDTLDTSCTKSQKLDCMLFEAKKASCCFLNWKYTCERIGSSVE